MCKMILFSLVLLFGGSFLLAQEIILPKNPLPSEKTAEKELRHYLPLVVSGELTIDGNPVRRIYIGRSVPVRKFGVQPEQMPDEAWKIKSTRDELLIAGGGTNGTLYGVYNFLENQLGIHWWSPTEEYLPPKGSISLPALDLSGKPYFLGRDIYRDAAVIADGGRFVVRNRMNRNGDLGIVPEYGGMQWSFGRPYFVHTFDFYFPVKTTPKEYFALKNGKREGGFLGQLCLTNQDMRKDFLKKLKAFIESDEKSNPPHVPHRKVYDVSPNDVAYSCECQNCQALIKKENSAMGLLLDFVNEIAREIKVFRPDLIISTTIYANNRSVPATIRPESNVMMRFCNQSQSMGLPLSAPENADALAQLAAWKDLSPYYYCWYYCITFTGRGFPYANEQFLEQDLRLFAKNKIRYFFWEHEDSDIGDMHTFKVWLECKLLENPFADADALRRKFLNLYYGEAGQYLAKYRELLNESLLKTRNLIPVQGSLYHFSHLTYPVVRKSQELFDQAEKAVADDPVLLNRVKIARIGLDRYTLLGIQKLMKEYQSAGGKLENQPFDIEQIASRVEAAYLTNLKNLRQETRPAFVEKIKQEMSSARNIPLIGNRPAFFTGIPDQDYCEFTPEKVRFHRPDLKIVKDADAESGVAVMAPAVKKKELPLLCGAYGWNTKQVARKIITSGEVKKSGYNWYKLFTVSIPKDSVYVYFLADWTIQIPLPENVLRDPKVQYDVWASIKFSGKNIPHSGKEPEGVYLERLVLVRHKAITLE